MLDFKNKVKPIVNWLPQVQKELMERGGEPPIPITSLPRLNHLIWGFKPKTLVVLASRTSQGKTSLVTQLAYDFADSNLSTLFLSLEDDVEFITERIFCNTHQVNNFDLMRGLMAKDPQIQDKWKLFCKSTEKLPLTITCGIGSTFPELNSLIEMLNPKPRIVILDYVQNIRREVNEGRERINEYIRYFRELMIKHDMLGILVSQINRKATDEKNNEPHLHQLKETGVLEESADLVILLHWNYFYTYDQNNRNEFKIIVAKNKRGKCGEHIVQFYPEFFRFEEQSSFITPEEKAREIFNAEK